ncbi:M55 family metallopeptidase [Paenibacillus elgii]|uniref:M55 family metallopeptidase n=1 Tax=Paenibacillus elgii TaxID=189691 RepID=UPI0013D83A85
MKIFIFADMEGISGVVDPTFLHPGESNYEAGCRLMAHDVGRDRVQRDLCRIPVALVTGDEAAAKSHRETIAIPNGRNLPVS